MNTQDRAAMQKAVDWIDWYTTPGGDSPGYSIYEVARTLREALAQPPGEWVDLTVDEINTVVRESFDRSGSTNFRIVKNTIAKFKEKNTPPVVPQGEPDCSSSGDSEPVAWMRLNEKSECEAIEYIGNVDEHLYLPPSCQWLYISPVLTMQQVEPKPVAKVGHLHQSIVEACGLPMSTPLYASLVRTKDLTDDEIMKINVDTAGIVPTCNRQFHFARAVIAADREKNNANNNS